MHIGHVTNYLPGYHDTWGGAEQAAHRLIVAQAERGLEVTVFSTKPKTQPSGPLRLVPLKRLSDFSWRLYKAVRSCPVIDRNRLCFDPVAGRSFAKALAEHRPDVIHFHNINELTFAVVAAAAKAGLPSVLSVYDYWALCPNEMLIDSDGKPCRRFHGPHCVSCLDNHAGKGYIPSTGALRMTERLTLGRRKRFFDRFLNRVDAFVVLSEASAELLRDYGIEADRVSVVRQPFDFGDLHDSPRTDPVPNSILYVGWIQYKKGLHVILDAVSTLVAEFPDLKLHVVGQYCDPVYSKSIEDQIERLRLSDRVVVHGKLPHTQVRDLMLQAQLLVLAEQWENMSPVVLVEAMACGLPVVAGRIGGIPEFVRHEVNGLLAEYDDPVDFASKIAQQLRSPSEATAMAQHARAAALELFDCRDIASRSIELYERLART